MIYLITGPGRTGSLLLCNLLSSMNTSWPEGLAHAFMPSSDSRDAVWSMIGRPDVKNLVIHTHNPKLVDELNLPADKIFLILSKRKDIFRTVMSHKIASLTEEWHNYTGKKPNPVAISVDDFVGAYYTIKNWYNQINTYYPFYNITEIYYEDLFVDNHRIIKEKLGLTDPGDPSPLLGSSPYYYKDWISNWEELLEIYHKLEKGS